MLNCGVLFKENRFAKLYLWKQIINFCRKCPYGISIKILQYNLMKDERRKISVMNNIPQVTEQLKKKGMLHLDLMNDLIKKVSLILKRQPNMLSISSPTIVVGDIHGQFYDLLNIFETYGTPPLQQYLFLGDYVDRGAFNIEVLTLLLFFKLKYPEAIHLLRGNHQCRTMTSMFNFRQECLHKYNQSIYEDIMRLFDLLPVAALIDKKYFAVHGGISPNFNKIEEIQQIDRFKEIPIKGVLCDLLWSDPKDQITDRWTPNNTRQCSYYFGIQQARTFMSRNRLKLIIRGHQVQPQGFKYQTISNIPLTLTIFSAPNYAQTHKNKGAIAMIEAETISIKVFKEVQHPFILPNFKNAFQWSVPFVGQCINHLFMRLLSLQAGKLNDKLDDIISNKIVFEKDYDNLSKVMLIDKIISLAKGNQQKSEIDYLDISYAKSTQTELQYFQQRTVRVIGPKLSNSQSRIRSITLQDENLCDQ